MSPSRFASKIDPSYKPGLVHYALGAFFEKYIKEGNCKWIINMPPQHGKSKLFSVWSALWSMIVFPGIHVVNASYSLDLAVRNSLATREWFNNEIVKGLFGFEPKIDTQDFWSLSNGSDYKAIGVGGGLTGFSADLLILDDLHKDAAEARSQVMRDKVWDWLQAVVMTRRSPKASVILIGTRWHQDDITGRLLAQEHGGWRHTNLRALAGSGDWLKRPVGEPLWPERYDKQWLENVRNTTSRYHYSALYDGNPIPDGGNHIDIEKFNHISISEVPHYSTGARWVIFWDLAVTENKQADYTAGAICANDRNGNLYIIEIVRGNWIWTTVRQKICDYAKKLRFTTGVEEVGLGKGLVQNLREVFPSDVVLQSTTPDKDKLTRALPWFDIVNKGKGFIVDGTWTTDFLNECQSFPLGENDDQIDAVSGCVVMLNSFYLPVIPMDTNRRGTILTNRRSVGLFS